MPLVLFNPSVATTPGQSRPGSDSNKGVPRIPQSSSTTGTSPSDCLLSYPRHSLVGGAYPYTEVPSMYYTAPADRAIADIGKIGWLMDKEIDKNV